MFNGIPLVLTQNMQSLQCSSTQQNARSNNERPPGFTAQTHYLLMHGGLNMAPQGWLTHVANIEILATKYASHHSQVTVVCLKKN